MNNRFLKTAMLVSGSIFALAGCSSDNSSFETPNTSSVPTNQGTVSQKNFSLLASDPQPLVIDPATDVFAKTDVTMTVYIGDRNNQTLTNSQTVYFRTEYGTIEPSCITQAGSCSVTWSAIKRPLLNSPLDLDRRVTIIAYTLGEESFTDTNGNGVFDDGDLFSSSDDLEEPYIDADNSDGYDFGEDIVDTVNGVDPTGKNEKHDFADSLFNGPGCTHSSLCSTTVTTNATIWAVNTLKIDGPPPAAP